MDQTCFLFMEDHKIKYVKPEKLNTVDKLTKYVLIPNDEDENFFICKPSKYFSISKANIRYWIYCYVRNDCEYPYDFDHLNEMNDNNIWNTPKEISIEINNPFDLFNAIHSMCKICGANQLFFVDNIDTEYDNSICIIIDKINIDCEYLDGSTSSFEWYNKKNISAESLSVKMKKTICKEFKVPDEFLHKEKCFIIENEEWKIKDIDSLSKDHLIGFISDAFSNISFINYHDYSILSKPSLLIDITASTKDAIYDTCYNPNKLYTDMKFLQDYDLASLLTIFGVCANTFFPNDTLSFFLNIHYLFRHFESLVKLIEGNSEIIPVIIISIQFMKMRNIQPHIVFHKELLPSLEDFEDLIEYYSEVK